MKYLLGLPLADVTALMTSSVRSRARSAQARVRTDERGTGLVREQRISSTKDAVGLKVWETCHEALSQERESESKSRTLLTDYAFNTLTANRIEIRSDELNLPSGAIPQRLDYLLEGRLRDCIGASNCKLRTLLIFALTPADRF